MEKLYDKPPEKVPVVPSGESRLASAELVFPLKPVQSVIASLPESVLPLCRPESLSCYRCQHPSCDQEFLQKAAACNHVFCDHLNMALACLSCCFNNTPKMQWYSASAWEHHTHKHVQDNLPIHPNDPTFYQQFSEAEAIQSTSNVTPDLTHANIIQEMAKAAKQFLKEGDDKSTLPSTEENIPGPSKSLSTMLNKVL